MTPADLRSFRIVERALSEGQSLDTLWATAAKAGINFGELNVYNTTHGGPVFMGIGEGIDIEMLEVSPEDAAHLLVHDTVKVHDDDEPGNRLLASAAANEAKDAGKKTGKVDRPTTKAHRYFFTDDPVEKFYYKQPVAKKVVPTSGLTTGDTPIEVSGAWFD